jgi:hypothetical protein
MHNDIYTGDVSNEYAGGLNSTDAIYLYGSTGGHSAEIAYNDVRIKNIDAVGHKDLIQSYLWQLSGGTTKIHHNFFLQDAATTHTAGLYLSGTAGYYQVYNNIVSVDGDDGAIFGFYKQNWSTSETYKLYVKAYNNTIVDLSDGDMQTVKFYGCDSVDFRNNLIYAPSATIGMYLSDNTVNEYTIDYNQFYIADTSSFAYLNEGFSASTVGYGVWKSTYSVDANSETGSFSLVDATGTDLTDYALSSGSSGIDEGTTLTLFSDDIQGTVRPQGTVWDRGAFETTSYFDDFSDGDYSSSPTWTVASGTFAVTDTASNPLSANVYALHCNSTGTISVPQTTATATFEFDLYKDATVEQSWVSFLDDNTTHDDEGGYRFEFNASDAIRLVESGIQVDLASAGSYISPNTWYRIKIVRTSGSEFTVSIKGGAYTNWTEVVAGGSG